MVQVLKLLHRFGISLQIIKTALATGFAWYIASAVLHNSYPYFAALGAIFTVQVTIMDSIQKAIYRVIGIIGGVIVSLLIGHVMPLTAWSVTLVVLVGMAVSTALRVNSQITNQVAVSSLLVLAFQHTTGYALDRIIETIIGCVVALIINIVMVPPNVVDDAQRHVLQLGHRATTVLQHLAIAYQELGLRPVDLPYVQELVSLTEKSLLSAQLAQQSLKYSPLLKRRNHQFIRVSQAISRLEHITIQIRGIARGLVDLGRETMPDPGLIESMKNTAPCVGLFVESLVVPSEKTRAELARAVEGAHTCQSSCLEQVSNQYSGPKLRDLCGILTDLNRILEEVENRPLIVTGREFNL